ncbi:CHAT domain-containing protein [Paucibacter sp. XJ19-41]|uniref:CHAT domain-containing protein n=1 Tax=Paucibacter sp. XJ19-41 TaxID=2927824 RepID=UPI00234BF4BD|nr:CHAT domain-containing protein [Paucibacter sp. XJ19-41]MDC6170699.1 CHAT domain-containing protein [Paucibacter sp. XJ19-41]
MATLQGPGAHSDGDLEEAFKLLMSSEDRDAIARLIATQPLVHDPRFHSFLRQRRLQLDEAEKLMPGFSELFLERHDALFTMLHMRAYARKGAAAVPGSQTPAAAACARAPELMVAILNACSAAGGGLPSEDGPTHVLPEDQPALEEELRTLLPAGAPDWPAWAPRAGGLFGLLLLGCVACRKPRLALRAWAVDDEADRGWRDELLGGRLNADACPHCGSMLAWPARIWAAQSSQPLDPLATLSCLFRLSGRERIYLPPPETARDPALDRVMEARLDILGRQLGPDWSLGEATGSGVYSEGIAYGINDLRRRLDDIKGRSPSDISYEDMVRQIVHRLREGELSFWDAEAFLTQIASTAMAQWPVILAEGGEPVEVLVRRLVLESCLRAQGATGAALCGAAASVVQAYCALGQVALAEMSLARAHDLLAEHRGGDLGPQLSVLMAQESLHIARGGFADAARVREEIRQLRAAADAATATADVMLAMNQALFVLQNGDLPAALIALRQALSDFERLERERHDAADQPGMLAARQGRSGCVANLGCLKAEAAVGLELLRQLTAAEGDFSLLPADSIRQLQRFGNPGRTKAVLRTLLLNWAQTQAPASALASRQEAEADLRLAIALATETGQSEYLGIQHLQLARLLRESGRVEEAYPLLPLALRHATSAGDQQHVAAAARELASCAAERGDRSGELDALETLMRSEIRAVIEGRSDARELSHTAALSIHTVCADGVPTEDIARAIVLAESGKRVALARSMRLGTAWLPKAGAASSQLATLLDERDELRQGALWASTADGSAERSARLHELEALIHAERVALAQRDPRYAAWHDATWAGLTAVPAVRRALAALGPHTTWVGLLVEAGTAYAYALWADGAAACAHPAEGNAANWLPQLLDGLALRFAQLRPDDVVLISPSAELEDISWAELPMEGAPLVERVALSVVPGVGVLEVCAARAKRTWKTAACLGAPHRPNLPFLDAARKEVERVAADLDAAGMAVKGPFVGLQANIGTLAEIVEGCDLVHLACHGELTAGGGVDLMLAPNLIEGDSGILGGDTVVSAIRLADGALVVLAACSSASAGASSRFVEPGQVPAWLIAGAGTVLACLRPIEDDAARRLHASFYGNLFAGVHAAVALARSQREAARGNLGPELVDPRQWGAYALFGA